MRRRALLPTALLLAASSLPLTPAAAADAAGSAAGTTPPAESAPQATAGTAAATTGIPTDPSALLALVLDLDRRMFAAYDAHDVDALMSWFAPDLEFFHDTGGLANWEQVKAGFTGVFARNPDIRRELVPGTTRVFPIRDYGAIQIGRHRFCHTENGRQDCGTFEFVRVWRLRDGRRQVARELSYGH